MSRRGEIHTALWNDYRKPAPEVDLTEIYAAVGEAKHAIRHLRSWMRPRRVAAPIALFGSRSRIIPEPKGVVLIISPWNFPINLTIGPLISAIAAGNCVMIKPSELTPHASAWMKKMLADLFDESEVAVIEGDASVAAALLERRFDHIFFTGSPQVGKAVMKAAAEHLTSVTLELGGKSPVIVDRTANLDEAAKKIAWGKFLNSGQICIAPDYLLVDEAIRAPFVEKLRDAIKTETGWIVNDRHTGRIERIDALRIINEKERPLVLYLFSRSRRVIRDVLAKTSAGGTAVNDTLVHFYQLNLPFGGIGNSGIGKAHGVFGFEAFSNLRGVFEQPTRFSTIQLLYPPYTAFKQKLIDLTLKYF